MKRKSLKITATLGKQQSLVNIGQMHLHSLKNHKLCYYSSHSKVLIYITFKEYKDEELVTELGKLFHKAIVKRIIECALPVWNPHLVRIKHIEFLEDVQTFAQKVCIVWNQPYYIMISCSHKVNAVALI